MAGDWMKVELELPDKPEVHYIAGALNLDPDAVVGKLLRVWAWFDKHTTDGNALGVTYSLLDRISGVTGFGEAMSFAGWMDQRDRTLVMPKFDSHTSKSAKNRALTAKRVGKKRNADVTLAPLPREEKRREEKKEHIPKAAKAKETPMPADFALSERVKAWAAEKGHGNLEQRFEHFCGLARAKAYRYADWDEALMNAIRGDWAKLGTQTTGKPGGGRPKLA